MKNKQIAADVESSVSAAPVQQPVSSNSDYHLKGVSKLDNSFIHIAEKTQYSEQVRQQILQGLMLIPENINTTVLNGGTRIIIDSDSSNMGRDPGFDAAGKPSGNL